MLPLQRYKEDLEKGLVSYDPEQERILILLDQLHQAILNRNTASVGFFARLFTPLKSKRPGNSGLKGLYLWGGVGRGKTYMMDLFYDCLPGERKQRTHFYRFMQQVHGRLTALQGSANPLHQIAAEYGKSIDVLCFDEFFVSDIGDAMLMAGLLEALFQAGVVLVATSNVAPKSLYENGLQRERFLPAIDLIESNTQVVKMEEGVDYRLRSLSGSRLYLAPMSPEVDEQLCEHFAALAPDHQTIEENQSIQILGREIPSRASADDVAWFRFGELCDGPRSAFDYVEIAKLFHALILSEVPRLDDGSNEQARRFVSLIDELYDRRVKLILAADVALPDLYQGKQLAFEFQRTRSRLVEMQTHDYLASGHRA